MNHVCHVKKPIQRIYGGNSVVMRKSACTMQKVESMSKEKQIQEYENKQLIDELSKMPPIVIATAYLHAINYTLYGEDVTKAWVTATQQSCVLEKAYNKGYYDALRRQKESEDKE